MKHALRGKIKRRARAIFDKVQEKGPQQVRLYRGWLLAFRYPAPRGYGTRGTPVGVYTPKSKLKWIEDDLLSLIDSPATAK